MNTQSTQSVWDFLSSIPIGTIVAWGVVICAIISFFCAGIVKLYKAFSKYSEIKDKNEKYQEASQKHEEKLNEMSGKMDKLLEAFEKQRQINYKQVRLSIVRTCNEALNDHKISATKYKALMEMYEEYLTVFADMKPNGYVHGLVDMIKDGNRVEIVGKVEE